MSAEYVPAIRHDAIGLSGKKRAMLNSKIPSLLFPGEQAVFIGPVDRQADGISYLAITNYRIIATTSEIFPVFELRLSDIQGFKIGFWQNLEVTVGGRQVKLGNIEKEKDIPRIKYFLGKVAAQDTIYDTINRIVGEVAVAVPATLSGGPIPDPYRPQGVGGSPITALPNAPAEVLVFDPEAFGHLPEIELADIQSKLRNLLTVGERVACAAKVVLFEVSKPGWVVITDHRLITFTNDLRIVLDILLSEVSAFEANQNELVSLTVDGQPVVIGLMEKHGDTRRLAKALQAAIAKPAGAPPAAPTATTPIAPPVAPPSPAPEIAAPLEQTQVAVPDLGAKLTQLAELHRQGILTDHEFAAAKARVLGL